MVRLTRRSRLCLRTHAYTWSVGGRSEDGRSTEQRRLAEAAVARRRRTMMLNANAHTSGR